MYSKGNIEDYIMFRKEDLYETEIAKQCFNVVGVLVLVIEPSGKISFLNKKGRSLLGFSNDELLDKVWIDKLVQKSEQQRVQLIFNELVEQKNTAQKNFKCPMLTKKEKSILIDAKLIPILDSKHQPVGYLLSGEEVTNYVKIHKELQNSLNLYHKLANNIPEINLFLFDEDLRFIIAEGAEMKKRGFKNSDFERKTLQQVYKKPEYDLLEPIYRSALDGVEVSKEIKILKNDYLIWAFPLKNDNGEIFSGMVITQNITKNKKTAKRLQKAKVEAEEANKTKSDFLANVTHEIRTPLNAIIGFSEQLLKTTLNERQLDFVNVIEKSSEHLLSLVNDILVLSKIEANKVDLNIKPFKIIQVIKYLHNTLGIKAEQKNIRFTYDIDPNLNRVVLGDNFRLRQILMNMVSNSIKFTESGYVEIKSFIVKETDTAMHVRFDIIDTGIGITKEKLKTVFEPFKQADSTMTKKYGGTGLGLSISKRLIEVQGGTIKINSEEGMGTHISVVIPYKKGRENEYFPEDDVEIDKLKLDGLSVLIVDDDSVNRLLGKTILEDLNCKVDLAMDGKNAIEKLIRGRYDIVLLDIHMPEVSGFEVAEFVRKEQRDLETKIIAVTAAVLKDGVENYFKSGMNDYLIKPFKEVNLYQKMCKVLGVGDQQVKLSRVEEVLNNEADVKMYSLEDLEDIAKGNNKFIKEMLNAFVDNAINAIEKMEKGLKEKDWKLLGETAHKVLPSYKHLQVQSIIPLLIDLKNKTIITQEFEDVPILTKNIISETRKVLQSIEIEMSKF